MLKIGNKVRFLHGVEFLEGEIRSIVANPMASTASKQELDEYLVCTVANKRIYNYCSLDKKAAEGSLELLERKGGLIASS